MGNKFSRGLVKEYKAECEEARRQEKLRKEYNISDENIKVVEKKTTFKFVVNLLISFGKLLATIALLVLAAVGLTCLLYPAPRAEFLVIFDEVLGSLKGFLGLS